MNPEKEDTDNIKITGEEPGVPANRERKPDAGSKFTGFLKNMKTSMKVACIVLSGVCIAGFAAYSLMREKPQVKETPALQEEASAEAEKGTFAFEPFIAPFGPNDDYTYMKVNLSFGVTDEKLRDEMSEKRNLLRKTIYEVLLAAIKEAKTVPAPGDIKKEIGREINSVLVSGKIERIFITEYTAV